MRFSRPTIPSDEAYVELNKVVDRCPALMQARVDRARALVRLGKQPRRLPDLLMAEKDSPREPTIHFLLAAVYRAQGKSAEAQRDADLRQAPARGQRSRRRTGQRCECDQEQCALICRSVSSSWRLFCARCRPCARRRRMPLSEARALLDAGKDRRIGSSSSAISSPIILRRRCAFPCSATRCFASRRRQESLAEFTAGAKFRRPRADELKVVAADYVMLRRLQRCRQVVFAGSVRNAEDADAWYLLGRTQVQRKRVRCGDFRIRARFDVASKIC